MPFFKTIHNKSQKRFKRAAAKVRPVSSLPDLWQKAAVDPNYAKLVVVAAGNIGALESDVPDWKTAFRYLQTYASETSEQDVIDEVNFVLDLVNEAGPVHGQQKVKQLATELLQRAMESDAEEASSGARTNTAYSVALAIRLVSRFNASEMESFLDELPEFFTAQPGSVDMDLPAGLTVNDMDQYNDVIGSVRSHLLQAAETFK